MQLPETQLAQSTAFDWITRDDSDSDEEQEMEQLQVCHKYCHPCPLNASEACYCVFWQFWVIFLNVLFNSPLGILGQFCPPLGRQVAPLVQNLAPV